MNVNRVNSGYKSALRAELVSRVNQSAALRPQRARRRWLTAGALAATGLVGAAAGGVLVLPSTEQTSPQPPVASSYRVEDTVTAFRGLQHDYDAFSTPKALAASSQAVVQGTVSGIREGRTGRGINSIVVVIKAEKVVDGGMPQNNDGSLYLELPGSGSTDPAYYTKALPSGSNIVAYVVAAPNPAGEGVDVTIDDPKAGRPAGQSIFLPAGPQGVILQVGGEDIVWPLLGVHAPGNIADTLPDGNLIKE